MDFRQEATVDLHKAAQIVAVAAPVLVIIAIDLYLALNGELDTLLVPRVMGFPRIELDEGLPPFDGDELEAEPAPERKAA